MTIPAWLHSTADCASRITQQRQGCSHITHHFFFFLFGLHVRIPQQNAMNIRGGKARGRDMAPAGAGDKEVVFFSCGRQDVRAVVLLLLL